MKVPFGIAQTGKAFRNEIVARQFIFRMREFEQMEMQFFVRPGEEMKHYNFGRSPFEMAFITWFRKKIIVSTITKLAHYANADIEFNFPFGSKS
jgi:glycyl-tRNA synthetase